MNPIARGIPGSIHGMDSLCQCPITECSTRHEEKSILLAQSLPLVSPTIGIQLFTKTRAPPYLGRGSAHSLYICAFARLELTTNSLEESGTSRFFCQMEIMLLLCLISPTSFSFNPIIVVLFCIPITTLFTSNEEKISYYCQGTVSWQIQLRL